MVNQTGHPSALLQPILHTAWHQIDGCSLPRDSQLPSALTRWVASDLNIFSCCPPHRGPHVWQTLLDQAHAMATTACLLQLSSRLSESKNEAKILWSWWWRSACDVHQQLEGRGTRTGFIWKGAAHWVMKIITAGYERKTLRRRKRKKKKKRFCSWFIFLLWAYPVSSFLEKSCSLRYNLSVLETLLPQEVCNSGKNKSWGCLKEKFGKSNWMAVRKDAY